MRWQAKDPPSSFFLFDLGQLMGVFGPLDPLGIFLIFLWVHLRVYGPKGINNEISSPLGLDYSFTAQNGKMNGFIAH